MKRQQVFPFPECKECMELTDCPHPEVDTDMMGTPIPPDCCPHPLKIVNRTTETKRNKIKKRHARDID
jgi:hypothetical protein